MALGLMTGCGSNSSGSSSGTTKVLFIMTDTEDAFRTVLAESVISAADAAGVELDMVETGSDVNAQLDQVRGAKDAGYSAIIQLLANSDTALQMQVASNGLPIVYINVMPDESVLEANQYVYVGSDEEQAGTYQAEYVWNTLGKPSSLNAIILEGEPNHSGTIGRTSAVKNYFKDQGVDANYVFVDYCNWSDEEAQEKLELFFQTGQSVDAVFCNNDTMALGAVEALQAQGIDIDAVPICGVDATVDGCASIVAGEMQFTVLQDALGQAEAAVAACQALVESGDISSVENVSDDLTSIWVPFKAVDAENVADYM